MLPEDRPAAQAPVEERRRLSGEAGVASAENQRQTASGKTIRRSGRSVSESAGSSFAAMNPAECSMQFIRYEFRLPGNTCRRTFEADGNTSDAVTARRKFRRPADRQIWRKSAQRLRRTKTCRHIGGLPVTNERSSAACPKPSLHAIRGDLRCTLPGHRCDDMNRRSSSHRRQARTHRLCRDMEGRKLAYGTYLAEEVSPDIELQTVSRRVIFCRSS